MYTNLKVFCSQRAATDRRRHHGLRCEFVKPNECWRLIPLTQVRLFVVGTPNLHPRAWTKPTGPRCSKCGPEHTDSSILSVEIRKTRRLRIRCLTRGAVTGRASRHNIWGPPDSTG